MKYSTDMHNTQDKGKHREIYLHDEVKLQDTAL